MISADIQKSVVLRNLEIAKQSGFTRDEKRMLMCAVHAMANEFADLSYDEIPDWPKPHAKPELLRSMIDDVRAALGDGQISPITVDQTIRRYELIRPIWLAMPELGNKRASRRKAQIRRNKIYLLNRRES